MKRLILANDKYGMNWIEGDHEWGTVRTPEGICAAVQTERDGDVIRERYTFTNISDKDIFTCRSDISIYTPFNDDYNSSAECVKGRCHTHIWCGGEISYVMALRMGGEAPHLGLVLTEGSLCGYSVERDPEKMSNDRGDFILHPSPAELGPNESFSVAWTLFPHTGKQDFYRKLPQYCPQYIEVRAENYVVFGGEKIRIRITPCFDFETEDVSIEENGRKIDFVQAGEKLIIRNHPDTTDMPEDLPAGDCGARLTLPATAADAGCQETAVPTACNDSGRSDMPGFAGMRVTPAVEARRQETAVSAACSENVRSEKLTPAACNGSGRFDMPAPADGVADQQSPAHCVCRRIMIEREPETPGEYIYSINIKGVRTFCRILAQPALEELTRRRCEFIAEKQQYSGIKSGLDGAYLTYDTEENHMYYNRRNDYNGGRERVGMGLLLVRYLQSHASARLEASLKKYIAYVERELLDRETGEVFNDYGRDNSYKRLYNYPWMSLFYLELYALYGGRGYLLTAYRILMSFYSQGGAHFYSIELPLERILQELRAAQLTKEYDSLLACFRRHCAFILERGTDYPAHEVNYEQSIVAPAANILLEMYKATGEKKYFDGAKRQLEVLELFNGLQPDYHLYETAIRHWDGYWFGKNRLFGDTFPHYWSALTANAYKAYGEITGNLEYTKKAEAAFRSVMALFHPDGSASCAYVYPMTVNGVKAEYFDPFANDQDWGMYFSLSYEKCE